MMKQQLGLVLALASAAPAVAGEPLPEPRLPTEGDPGQSLAALASGEGAEAALAEGRAHLASNNAVQAISAFRLALASDANSVAALNGLGIAYDRLGRSDLARRHFEMALAIEPDAADIAFNLGWSLHLAGDHRGAVPWLQRASGGEDGRAAAAARRALALIAATLEAQASGIAPAPAVSADHPVRVASARIDMASTGEAVLVLPGAVAHPASRPVLALSVPVERVISAGLPALPTDVSALAIDLPDLAPPAAPLVQAAAAEAPAPAASPAVAAPVKTARAAAPASPAPAAVRDVLNTRLGALAALTIPLAVAVPVAAAPAAPAADLPIVQPPMLVQPVADAAAPPAPRPAREARLQRAARVAAAPPAPRVITLGDAPPDFDDLALPRAAEPVDTDTPPPLRLLDLAALPLLATATPMQPLPLLAPPRLAVDWMAGTDITHLAPEAEAPAYRRLMHALAAQAELADAVDPQAVRMAISRLEALVARIEAMSRNVLDGGLLGGEVLRA